MLKENLTTNELIDYAQDNGFDSLKFIGKVKENGIPFTGKFLDAYYELVEIPMLGEGFIRLSDISKMYGDRNVYYSIPENDEEYETAEMIGKIFRENLR
jgi:hypothetical protein